MNSIIFYDYLANVFPSLTAKKKRVRIPNFVKMKGIKMQKLFVFSCLLVLRIIYYFNFIDSLSESSFKSVNHSLFHFLTTSDKDEKKNFRKTYFF